MGAFLSIVTIGFGLILSIVGFIGCLFPVVPGPPLCFAALLILSWVKGWQAFSVTVLLVMGGLTGAAFILDYAIPAAGAKRYGASGFSVFCSVCGMVVGLFAFPPFGLFIGGFAGAVVGELYVGKASGDALRAGWGIFVGNLLATGLKLALCGVMLFMYVTAMF
jgi:uncharacterized protein YqgC (DUF456 family)